MKQANTNNKDTAGASTSRWDRITSVPFAIHILILAILDLGIAYLCCYFSIGSHEDQVRIFREGPLRTIAINFVFSFVTTYVLSTLCMIVIHGVVRLLTFLINSTFNREVIKKKGFGMNAITTASKLNLLIVGLVTIFWLCYKFYSGGYV